MNSQDATEVSKVRRQRLGILAKLEHGLELPMFILAIVWLVLMILDLSTAWGDRLRPVSNLIWILFIFDFGLRVIVAPNKGTYLLRNWLTVLALLLPALRIMRVARAFRFVRFTSAASGTRLLRVLTSINRSMNSFSRVMKRRGFSYVVLITTVVTFSGAAGMYAFEREHGIESYGSALWWTAMIVTTMGSEYWPKSAEGRLLCFLLAIYSFSVFGYVTASLATFFIEQDSADRPSEKFTTELAELRQTLADLSRRPTTHTPD